jgi:branched-chain amino acid transport system ATP-binding protein
MSIGYEWAICSDISFELQQGRSILVTGHNGTGKTTLLRTLFGLVPALQGECELLGLNVRRASAEKLIRAGVRFLGQGARSFDDLPLERSREVLRKLYGFQPDTAQSDAAKGHHLSARLGDLSIGQRRIEALRLLKAGSPRLYLLDEPLAGVDVAQEDLVLNWIASEQGKRASFIIAEHRFRRLLPVCDVTMVMRSGRIGFLGSSSELLNEQKAAEVLL